MPHPRWSTEEEGIQDDETGMNTIVHWVNKVVETRGALYTSVRVIVIKDNV